MTVETRARHASSSRVRPRPAQSRTVRLADIAAAAAGRPVDNRLWSFARGSNWPTRRRQVGGVLRVRRRIHGRRVRRRGRNLDENSRPGGRRRGYRRRPGRVRRVGEVGFASARAAAAERSCGFEVECNATLDDGEVHCDLWINGTAGEALLPPGLKRAAVALARRHGCVRATLAASGGRDVGDDGPRFFSHDLRGYAGLPMSKVEGAPLVAAVGHAKSQVR